MKNQLNLLVENPVWSTSKTYDLVDGFSYESIYGDRISILNHAGEPVDLPLDRKGKDLIIKLNDNGGAATIENFFVDVKEESTLNGIQSDEVEVSLGADDSEESEIARSATTEIDDSFTLIRGSEVSYLNFGNPGGSSNVAIDLFGGNGFSGGNYGGNVPQANQPAIARDDAASVDENNQVAIDLLLNDTDPEGGSLTLQTVNGSNTAQVTLPSGAVVTQTGGGIVNYDPLDLFDYLSAGATEIDSFTYTISDSVGNISQATATVTINGVNDAPPSNPGSGPGIYDDTIAINEDVATPATGNVLSNDSDPDGDSLTVTAVNGVSGNVGSLTAGSFGSITINSDGTYSYAVDNTNAAVQALGVGQFATDTFTYLADDGNGGSAAASLVVTINGVNDAPPSNPGSGPGIYDDTASISEDDVAPVTGSVLANDADPDGDSLTVTAVNGVSGNVGSLTAGSFGSITINSDGTYSYAVDNTNAAVQALGVGQFATDTFTYLADDGNGGSAAASLVVTINGVNDAPPSNPGSGPGIYDDTASIDEDDAAPATGSVLANDADPDGDSLTVTAVNGVSGNVGSLTAGSYGSITINSDGTYSYAVDNTNAAVQALGVGQFATDTFTYLADDGNGGSAAASIVVTINGVNDSPPSNPGSGPGIYDDTASINEDDAAPATGSVLANDADPDGDSLTVTAVNGVSGNVGSLTAGSFGSITINSDGTYSYAVDNTNAAVQALGVGQFATDTFTYLADDGNGGSAAASLVVTINGVNDAPPSNPGSGPGIYDDTDSINEDDAAPATGSVLANDADPDGDSLTVTAVNGVSGNVGSLTAGSYGSITINSDGTYSYAVDNTNAAVQALGVGQFATDTFTYLADDGNGGSAAASLVVTINGVNDAPPSNPGSGPGIYDDTASISEDDASPATGSVLANDTDPDGDSLTVTAVDGVSGNVGSLTAGSFGSITINSDGTYSYAVDNTNAAVQALGVGQFATDTFTYLADDGNGGSAAASLVVTINGVNDAPPSNPGSGPGIYDDTIAINEDDASPATGSVLANDADPDGDSLTVTAVNGVSGNVGSLTAGSFGSITINSDGTYSYAVDNTNAAVQALGVGQFATDTFTYLADDGNGGSAAASLVVTINGVNDAPPSNPGSGPGIYDDTASIDEDDASPVTGSVLANDTDPDGDSLTVTAVNGVSGNVGSLTAGSFGSITVNSDGTYSYAVDNTNAAVQALGVGQFATDTFTYLADDGNGGSAAASLVVTINGVNDAPPSNPGSGPGIYNDTASIDEDDASPATGSVLANDSDPDGDSLTVTAVNGVSGNVGSLTAGSFGSITINSDGTYSYAVDNTNAAVQALGVGQFATDTFTYLADDGNGGSAAASLVVTINGVNDAPPSNPGSGPGIYDDTASISEDDVAPATGSVLANDADPDGDSLTVTAVNGVSGNVGSLTAGSFGSITINSDGTYSYAVDNTNAAVQALGVGQFATDTFTYLADDGNGGSAAASLVVTINGVNDAPPSNPGSGPGIYDDTDSINEDEASPATGSVLANDTDPDGDSLTVTAVNGVSGNVGSLTAGSFGSITINSDGTYSYAVDNTSATVQALGVGQFATDTFTYLADDGNGGSAAASLVVTINGVNDAPPSNPGSGPGIYDDTDSINEDDATPATGSVLANDTDPDGDSLTVTAVNGVSGNVGSLTAGSFGSITINSDGTYSYAVDNTNAAVQALGVGQFATDTFTYLADDGNGGSAAASLVVTINGVNDAPPSNPGSGPGIYDDTDSINEDDATPATGSVFANDTDPDGDSLTVTAVNGVSGNVGSLTAGSFGSITINSDGTYSYAVDNTNAAVQALGVGQFATDTFTYLADDGNGGSAAASFVVTINGVNDAPPSNPGSGPGIYDDTDSIDEEDITPATGSVLANDADPDGDSLSVAAVNGVAGNVGNSISGSYGTITINADGTYSYTLNNADAAVQALEPGDTATETFSYLADDGNGGSAAATLTITINGELDNEAPVAVDDSRYSTPVYEDSLLLDGSFDNLLSIDLGLGVLSGGWLTGQGSPDSLVGADVTLDIPGVIDGVADTITSSPQGGVFIGLANSNGGESFYTTINNLTPGETYTVRFLQANVGIGGVTQEGDTARLRVDFGSETQYTNPMAYEGEGNQAWVEQSLTFTATNTSQRLEIFADDPDGDLLSGDEYIAIDALVVTAASADVVGYEFAGIDLLANDYDTEGDDFYLSHIDGTAVSSGDTVTLASGNTVTLNSDGTVTFEDDASPLDAGESETFTYTISDEWGQTSTATATMERPQFATDDGFNTVKGRIEANVLTNDDDTSFGALSVIETTGPGDGSVSMNADGTFTYIADPGFTGIDTFSYTVQAADGSTDVASVSINVDSPGTSTYGNLNIALVVDESGSIDLTEAGEIAVGLEAFVTSMLGSGNKISLIGMDDSSVNGRSDHIIEQEVTALSLLTFTTWIAGYRTGRTGNLSDYWESGLSVAANDLSETPDLVIVITDGARGTKSVAQGFVDDMESQGSHVFAIGVSPGNYFGASTDLDTATTDVLTSNPEEANLLLTDIMSTDYSDGGFAELGVSLGNLGPALEDFFTLTIPPVVIDMDNDGVEFDSVEEGIAFDVDGDGESEQVAWADEDDAVLVYDHDQDGDVTSRSEIAFADYKEGADTDLEGLQHFDSDGDGTLDADDEEFSKFALWQDSNGDGRVDEGEMISLLEAGIHSIELQSDQNSYSSADGDVTVHGEATVHYNDGSTGIAADAEFDFSEILADDTEDEDSFEVHTEDGETINLDENAAHAHTCPESAEYCDMPAPPVATVDDQEFTQ